MLKSPKAARRSHEALPAGTVLYVLELEGKYYSYSYLHKEDALAAASNLDRVMDIMLFRWNFWDDPEKTVHVTRMPGKKYPKAMKPLSNEPRESIVYADVRGPKKE